MKLKWNTARIVLAAVLGSLFWAGCASGPHGQAYVENTTDLNSVGPDTHPELRTGLYDYNYQGYTLKSME